MTNMGADSTKLHRQVLLLRHGMNQDKVLERGRLRGDTKIALTQVEKNMMQQELLIVLPTGIVQVPTAT
jgi:hypothetical protein